MRFPFFDCIRRLFRILGRNGAAGGGICCKKDGRRGVSVQELVLEIINRFGYPGIGALILVEIIFPPIPSELILTFGGFLTTCSGLTLPGVILVSTTSSLVGAYLLYGLGRFLKPESLSRMVSLKAGRRLGFKPEDFSRTAEWFDRKGKKAVFFGRCIPIIRSLISVPAGMAGMGIVRFGLYTAAGSLIWDSLLVVLGAAAGQSWEVILRYTDAWSSLIKIGLGTLAAVLATRWWYRKMKGRKNGRKNGRDVL